MQRRSYQQASANIATATTDGAVIAAPPAGYRIRVFGLVVITGTSAAGITFNSKGAGAGTAISPTFVPAASGGFSFAVGDGALFQCNRAEGLTVTTGATTSSVAVQVVYDVSPL